VATLIVGIAGCGEGAPENGDYYNLTIASTYGGSVITPVDSESWYAANTTVELVAETDDHHHFVNWTGDVSSIADVYDPATNITMNDHYFITANFELDEGWYYLTIDSTYGGSVIEPGEGYFAYAANTTIDLVAQPDEHCNFVNWTGNVDTIADVGAAATNITMFGCYCITANFSPFAGGKGTAEDPYQIADWYQLDSVRYYLSSYFILINNLDSNSIGYTWLAGPTANGGKGWQPIGTFTGSFDGQGYDIRDLCINRPGENYVGLFGIIGGGWQIEEIGVVDVTVIGQDYVGGLAGRSYEGTVSHSYSTGSVTGNVHVGGLVGENDGIVSNSYFTGSVTGDSRVGGLVGRIFDSTVSNSYFTGSVTGNDMVGGLVGDNCWGTVSDSNSTSYVTGNVHVGGLVGSNYIFSTISNSYTTGSVTGDMVVGGLAGVNWATVRNSYSTGSVNGNSSVGGLLGSNRGPVSNSYSTSSVSGDSGVGGLAGVNKDIVVNCYATGSVTGNSYVGGLVGWNPDIVSRSFWDTETSGQASSDGGTGKTTAEMQDITTFSGVTWDIIAVGNPGVRNNSYIWNIVDDETYPFLSWEP
jgi:hypothetical protein